MSQLAIRAIGHVENAFEDHVPHDVSSEESRLVLDSSLRDGVQGLEPGAEILIIFWFHRASGFELLQHPRGDQRRPKRGVFSLRSPHRPNPIGASRVRLTGVDGSVLRVVGLDALNGTPILDLKPVEK